MTPVRFLCAFSWTSSSLGMCKRCGDLRLIACSRCKGSGSITRGGPFSLNPVDSAYQSFRVKSKELSISCTKCQAKGHFGCPACSRVPQAWSSIRHENQSISSCCQNEMLCGNILVLHTSARKGNQYSTGSSWKDVTTSDNIRIYIHLLACVINLQKLAIMSSTG